MKQIKSFPGYSAFDIAAELWNDVYKVGTDFDRFQAIETYLLKLNRFGEDEIKKAIDSLYALLGKDRGFQSQKPQHDAVNRPAHYTDGQIEVMVKLK